MHITILTVGSRGDFQPFLALAIALQQAGHRVRFATHANFKAEVRAYGLEFALITGNPQAVIQSDTGQAALRSKNPIEFSRQFSAMLNSILESALIDSWKACQGTEALIAGAVAFWGFDIAEALRIPCYIAALQPFTPTGAFAQVNTPQQLGRLGRIYNRFTFAVQYRLVWQFVCNAVNQFRTQTLKLPLVSRFDSPMSRMQRHGVPFLHAFSPAVVPKPADWLDRVYVTGYWFLEQSKDFTPPADLLEFLSAGSPPVYIGFGSMAGREPEETTEIALKALEKTGQRGILLTGWGGFSNADLPDTVLKLESIPHDWLFPQMACVVHHGGAGTTAATFRAGVPGIVIPYFADQPFWGYRAAQLGVSPSPIPRSELTADKLAAAILIALSDSMMRDRAMTLGKRIRSEDGIKTAVSLFEQLQAKAGHV